MTTHNLYQNLWGCFVQQLIKSFAHIKLWVTTSHMVHLFFFLSLRLLSCCLHRHTFSQSVHSGVGTARSVQGMILRVRTVAYCCEVAMGIQMSVASHAILVAGEKKHRDLLWTTQCSMDTLNKGIWDITVWNWFSADETEQWGAMRAHGAGPHWTQCIPSGLVKIRLGGV